MPTKPTIIELEMDKLEDVLRRVEANELTENDCATIRTLCKSYVHLIELLKNKNTSIDRLRKMLFGASTEKTAAVIGERKDSQLPPTQDAAGPVASAEGNATIDAEKAAKSPQKGHGRNGADAYTGAVKVIVRHQSMQPGDPCPHCGQGTVYEMTQPGVLVRLVGQAPIQAKVYEIQKLRCNLCSDIFPAQTPEGVGTEKYDATAGSMIALLKYSMGVPFNREEKLQEGLGIPLPASTQWDIVEAKAERIEPAFDELIRQAADGDVVYNDDSATSEGWRVQWEINPPGQ